MVADFDLVQWGVALVEAAMPNVVEDYVNGLFVDVHLAYVVVFADTALV
jgi:hypothetical protein